MGAFVGIRLRLLLRLTRSGLALLGRRRMDAIGRLVDIQLAGNLVRRGLEFLDALAQSTGYLGDTLGSENQEDGQEYEYKFKRSQASHVSAGWKRSIVQSVSELTTIRLFSGSSA